MFDETPVFSKIASRDTSKEDIHGRDGKANNNFSSLSGAIDRHNEANRMQQTERVSRNEMMGSEFTLMDAHTPHSLQKQR